ncbi:hypothetical protein Tco_0340694 [Tanacetum coccineum]
MEDEHLDTIPETESDEFIKSSVENLFPTPSEPEDFSDIESECDVLVCDNLTNFSNPLFDANDDDASSDEEEFKISSNPLFDLDEVSPIDDEVLESITSIPPGIDSFDAESDLIESLLNRDTSINDSQKIDSPLDEFTGELTLPHSIPPGIDDVNLDPEGDIFLSLHLLSLSRIVTLYGGIGHYSLWSINQLTTGIECDAFRLGDDDNSTSRPEFESFHVDYPDSGINHDVVDDIPNKIYDPGICIEVESTRFLSTLSPVIDTLLQFSSKNEDKVFNHSVLASKEKSSSSLSHRGFKASKLFHQKSPMLIFGDNTPNLWSVRTSPFLSPLTSSVWGLAVQAK